MVATSTAISQVIGAPIGAALMLMDGLRGILGMSGEHIPSHAITAMLGRRSQPESQACD